MKPKSLLQLCIATALLPTGVTVVANCFTATPQLCAQMNVTTCVVARDCAPVTAIATASADAYIYPATSATSSGVDKTKGQPGCIYPAYYLGCDGEVVATECGPTGAYTTPDFESGIACQTGG